MNCAEFHELAPGYALDALSEQERLACEHHLAHEGPHDGCEPLLARYEAVVGGLGSAIEPLALQPELWRALELRLGPSAQPQPTPLRAAPRSQPARQALPWALAAAGLLAALWSHGDGRNSQALQQRTQEQLARTAEQLTSAQTERAACATLIDQLKSHGELERAAVALLDLPGTRVARMEPTDNRGLLATALYNAERQRALIVSSTLAPVAGKDYELWVVADNQAARPAGFMRFDPSGIAIGEIDAALLRERVPTALAVSLEPAGGRPTPTEIVLLAKL